MSLSYSPISQGPFRLGVSANIFTDLQRKFNLHDGTRHAFLDNNGAFSKFFATTLGTPKKLKHLGVLHKLLCKLYTRSPNIDTTKQWYSKSRIA
jgi:hypothetical protein